MASGSIGFISSEVVLCEGAVRREWGSEERGGKASGLTDDVGIIVKSSQEKVRCGCVQCFEEV